jgi:hypothetical protein
MHQELIINCLKLLDGNLERINPNLPMEDQVDLLPFYHLGTVFTQQTTLPRYQLIFVWLMNKN